MRHIRDGLGAWVTGLFVVGALAATAGPAAAQERYALLVQGASGTDEYATLHRGWLDSLAGMLRDEHGYDADHLFVLAENPAEGERRATDDEVLDVLDTLTRTLADDDQLIVVLIGHGTAQGGEAKFNLIGPDLTATDWKTQFALMPGNLAIVNTASASFPFLAELSAPGRVVITATNSPAQSYATQFGGGFVRAFDEGEADLDKNGRISLLEAFTFASREVATYYDQRGTMATEHSMIDDNGDGEGRLAADEGEDGDLAGLTYFGGVAVATSDDPELQRLLTRQQVLTEQIDALRRQEASMAADEYAAEFERLVLELAQVSAEVRERRGEDAAP